MTKQNSAFCPLIHNGLSIHSKPNTDTKINHCCLRGEMYPISDDEEIWQNKKLIPLRELNNSNIWDLGCFTCQNLEDTYGKSPRTDYLQHLVNSNTLSGPEHLNIQGGISCNLACRSCGPELSSYWRKHIKENNLLRNMNNLNLQTISDISLSNKDILGENKIIKILRKLDLSNLKMVVLTGGETLLGNDYWKIIEELSILVPNAKNQLTICVQTNGTQTIDKKYYEIIERFHLFRLHVSLDAVGNQFNYLRWPAEWTQVENNLQELKENLPVNCLFHIECVIGVLNWYYHDQLIKWHRDNFSINRLGDPIDLKTHLVFGLYGLGSVTQEYADCMSETNLANLIPNNFKEDKEVISKLIKEIQLLDRVRNEDWTVTFPEISNFYSEYL